MSDVACVCSAPLVAEVRARGLRPEALIEGLPLDLAQLENPRQRIPWEPFTVFARRATELLGPDAVEEVAARTAQHAVPGLIRRALPLLASARQIYFLGARWWGPWIFGGTRAICEELPDGRLREVIEILPEYGACPEFFQGLRGVLRVMPLLFGESEALVQLHHDGRRGEFLIAAPPTRRRFRFGLRRRRRLAPLAEDLEELGFRQEQLLESMRRTRSVSCLLAEKSRRLDLLTRLGQELAQRADAHGLPTVVVGLLEKQLQLAGVRLWQTDPDGDSRVLLAQGGQPSGDPSGTLSLQAGRSYGGLLEIWGDGSHSAADMAILRELLPWINVALDQTRTGEAVALLTQLLEAQVADWSLVERGLERVIQQDVREVRTAVLAALREDDSLEEPQTVLLVESDAAVRSEARRLFEAGGFTVLEAGSGIEAAQVCETDWLPIHLLVTDASDPGFGAESVRRAMALHPELSGALMLRLRRA